MALGLGTGSTVQYFLEAVAERLSSGALDSIKGVPTSVRTQQACQDLDIPLTTLSAHPRLDVAVDGADEVDPQLRLIKGLGGALLREKMVAQASQRFVIIADDSKCVDRLGTRSPLPVEVVTFEWRAHLGFLGDLGAEPTMRKDPSGEPYVTDNGNYILDCRFASGIEDPAALDLALLGRAGIVDHGLFLGLASQAHIATPLGVQVQDRP